MALTKVFQVSRIPRIAVSKVIFKTAIAPVIPTIAIDQASFSVFAVTTPASFTASKAINPDALRLGNTIRAFNRSALNNVENTGSKPLPIFRKSLMRPLKSSPLRTTAPSWSNCWPKNATTLAPPAFSPSKAPPILGNGMDPSVGIRTDPIAPTKPEPAIAIDWFISPNLVRNGVSFVSTMVRPPPTPVKNEAKNPRVEPT